MLILSIYPINEVKLVAFLVLVAVALAVGLATGLTLGWRRGWLGKTTGGVLGFVVGVVAVVIMVAVVAEYPVRTEYVLVGPIDTIPLLPEQYDPRLRATHFGKAAPDIYERITTTWLMLYPIRVGVIAVCTWFATSRLWWLGLVTFGRLHGR